MTRYRVKSGTIVQQHQKGNSYELNEGFSARTTEKDVVFDDDDVWMYPHIMTISNTKFAALKLANEREIVRMLHEMFYGFTIPDNASKTDAILVPKDAVEIDHSHVKLADQAIRKVNQQRRDYYFPGKVP